MPIISVFYGLTIYMYFLDNRRHKLPHIHVNCDGEDVVVEIPTGTIIEGKLRRKQRRLVQAWIEIHSEDLMANWERAIAGKSVTNIEPLK